MLAEEFFSSVCGLPLTSNTAIAKDVGIYAHSLWPTFAAKSTFRKSATPPNCLAVNDTHVFAAQHEKGYVHVYSRLRGNQEAFVAFPERIRCLTLAGGVLVVGTVEGRIMLWEVGAPRTQKRVSCKGHQSLTHFTDMHWKVGIIACTSRPGCVLPRIDASSSPDRVRRLQRPGLEPRSAYGA